MDIQKDEQGYIVVETIGTFVPFVLLLVSILSLINIVTVQARMHYALTQTANTLSTYCYVLEVLGMSDSLMGINKKAGKTAEQIGEIKDNINAVINALDVFNATLGDIEDGLDAIGSLVDIADRMTADPEALFQDLMCYGLEELLSVALEEMARPLVARYLRNGGMTGDEYLKNAGVVDRRRAVSGLKALQFYQFSNLGTGNSALLDMHGNVKLTVTYEVKYMFGILPIGPTLRITHTVVTKAWLGGSGKGYWDWF